MKQIKHYILNHKYPQYNLVYPSYEPATTRWYLDNVKEDWTCFDCGANIGYFTVLFSRCASKGKVIAFEPTDTIEMLKQNCKENECENVSFHNLALGNKVGINEDKIYKIWGTPPEVKQFEFTTLDNFCETNEIEKLDLLKIDIDSYEYEMILGSFNTLIKFSPLIVIELNYALGLRNKTPQDVINLLTALKYKQTGITDENYIFTKIGE